jgi:hypothetical protein
VKLLAVLCITAHSTLRTCGFSSCNAPVGASVY